MKTTLPIMMAVICVVTTAATANADRLIPNEADGSRVTPHSPTPRPTGTKADAAALPPALAAEKAREQALRTHVNTADRFKMETPPPAARPENKPPPPAGNYVWVPGHWAPEAGEWKWIAGQWNVPATPSSVWIEAKYDRATKRWSPGYWQPDRPDSYENEPPAINPPPVAK